jgi:hypothetical protein
VERKKKETVIRAQKINETKVKSIGTGQQGWTLLYLVTIVLCGQKVIDLIYKTKIKWLLSGNSNVRFRYVRLIDSYDWFNL